MRKRSTFVLFLVLGTVFSYLQYRLWYGPGSIPAGWAMIGKIESQGLENVTLEERNRVLDAELVELKSGLETVEERARHELGMVKAGETLFLLPNTGTDVDGDSAGSPSVD
jgi:cell division protein FtsB